jgi:hypothetical protein
VVGESPLASPELALVDAELAAELRRSLCPVEDSWLRRRASSEEAPAAIEEDAPVQRDFADALGEAESGDAEQLHDYEYIVEVIEQTPAQSQRTSSHYPVLPAPEPEEEAIEKTDAALRRIRERLTDDESPARERKLRRRFTLASGATVLCALGVFAVDVQLQVAQLPGWFRF